MAVKVRQSGNWVEVASGGGSDIPFTFPQGGIIIWSGASNAIPTGWALCDGNNSTPDLRNRFVVGAGDTYSVDATGGSADATLPTHTHYTVRDSTVSSGGATPIPAQDLSSSNYLAEEWTVRNGGTRYSLKGIANDIANVAKTSSAGSSATNANLPPYYALCYIMKT